MKRSAGILLFRRRGGAVEVFLIHPGGPFWAKKDAGAWSIPKGEYTEGEDAFSAAKREFLEETGLEAVGDYLPLGEVKQKGGKVVTAWAVEQDFDATLLVSNTFEMEWPPGSGRRQMFPEADRGEWFTLDVARAKLSEAQAMFLDRLAGALESENARGIVDQDFPPD